MPRAQPHIEYEEREVRSSDPGLSPEANRLLTEEAREAIGHDRVRVPASAPPPGELAHGGHSPFVGTLVSARVLIGVLFLAAIVVGVVISLLTGSWWAVAAAAAAHALGTALVAGLAIQMTTQTEHVTPSVAARLEDEGVADPDAALTDLVEQLHGGEHARGMTEVISSGSNERTVAAGDDPGRAAVEQRTAMTPTSGASVPAGDRSSIAVLPWTAVLLSMTVATAVPFIGVAGPLWLVPAVVWPVAIGWLVLQWRMDSAGEERAAAQGRTHPPAEAARRPGQLGPAIAWRIAPLLVVFVGGVAAFVIIVGAAIGAL